MKDPEGARCRLFEIEQYICEIEDHKNSRVRCFPLPRVFRICTGRPAVEITAIVQIDSQTGELNVPERMSEILPKGKAWRDCFSAPGKSGRDDK